MNPNRINVKLTSNGNPILTPDVIDQANRLPPTVGENVLQMKRKMSVHNVNNIAQSVNNAWKRHHRRRMISLYRKTP